MAYGNALGLAQILGNSGIHQVQVPVLFQGRAGKAAVPVFIRHVRVQGNGQFLPVQQVLADSMAPVHGVPLGGMGVVLEKSVILPLKPAKPVGIVYPALFRLEMVRKSFNAHHKNRRAIQKPHKSHGKTDFCALYRSFLLYFSYCLHLASRIDAYSYILAHRRPLVNPLWLGARPAARPWGFFSPAGMRLSKLSLS